MSGPERIWAWTWHHKFPSHQNGSTQWNATIYPSDPEHCATEYRRADLPPTLSAALDLPEIKALVEALRECATEIDRYIRQEYPLDHPVHDRYRQRDFDANPAREALRAIEGDKP